MKSLRNRALAIVAVGIAALGVNARPASAQAAVRGHFTLPNEVHWQQATLPAGDYTFSIKTTSGPAQMELQGPNGGAFVVALTSSKSEISGKSALILEYHSGRRIVRELYLAPIGLRLHYFVPNSSNGQQLAQEPLLTEQVLVASN
jgi:hypothetical protein